MKFIVSVALTIILFFFIEPLNSIVLILIFILKLLKDYSTLLTATTALTNLLLVIYFFKINKKEAKEDRENAKKSYWYRDVILDRNLKVLDEKFILMHHQISGLGKEDISDEGLRTTVSTFTLSKRTILSTINDMVRIMDDSFAQELDRLLDDYEDYYSENIEELLTGDEGEWEYRKEKIMEEISDFKNKFLSKLYIFEKNNYMN